MIERIIHYYPRMKDRLEKMRDDQVYAIYHRLHSKGLI